LQPLEGDVRSLDPGWQWRQGIVGKVKATTIGEVLKSMLAVDRWAQVQPETPAEKVAQTSESKQPNLVA
jgi:hypothetical protein